MSDKLKQFITENRKAFDMEEPGSRVFKKIQQELSVNTTTTPIRRISLGWVACLAGIVLLSAGLYLVWSKKNNAPDPVANESTQDAEETIYGDPVYAKQIYHFKELIGLKQSELKQLETENPELYNQFAGDINQLDSSYQSLKIKLAENPNREMLLEAMIQNLQLQSDLLNRQLFIIKEIKQKSNRHEKSAI
ncbi:MAG: hypothetical protein H7Y01_01085 [Ferruginibacter sp.]|nr:hypothetical protein [Chitinophagaceae bacterium]